MIPSPPPDSRCVSAWRRDARAARSRIRGRSVVNPFVEARPASYPRRSPDTDEATTSMWARCRAVSIVSRTMSGRRVKCTLAASTRSSGRPSSPRATRGVLAEICASASASSRPRTQRPSRAAMTSGDSSPWSTDEAMAASVARRRWRSSAA